MASRRWYNNLSCPTAKAKSGISRRERTTPPKTNPQHCVAADIPKTSLIATVRTNTPTGTPALTASTRPLLEDAEQIDGPEITLTDNEKYCAFARFCDAKGRVWNLAEEEGQEAAELTIREANHCPAGRLSAWKDDKAPVEPHFDPGLGLLEDPLLRISSALWVRGGIPVQRPDGFTYEIRNRVTLCRCGHSSNKPFCDGTHASFKFRDGLPNRPDPNGEEY